MNRGETSHHTMFIYSATDDNKVTFLFLIVVRLSAPCSEEGYPNKESTEVLEGHILSALFFIYVHVRVGVLLPSYILLPFTSFFYCLTCSNCSPQITPTIYEFLEDHIALYDYNHSLTRIFLSHQSPNNHPTVYSVQVNLQVMLSLNAQ